MSQTRPIDPDTTSKRKRKNKPKAKPSDAVVPSDATELPETKPGKSAKRRIEVDLEPPETKSGKKPKRTCIDHDNTKTLRSEQLDDGNILMMSNEISRATKGARRHTDDDQMKESSSSHRVNMEPLHVQHGVQQVESLDQQLKSTKPSTSDFVFNPMMVNVTTQPQVPIVLEIYSLISRLPYAQMLNQVFTDDASSTSIVPVVTRAYEESYMREVIHAHERPCVCGESCECNFIDPAMPFVGVEFTMNDSSPTENAQQMCVLCSRRLTQELFFDMVYNGHRFRGTIQRYGNLCNQPLEYAREAMLICPQNGLMQNMPLPMVAHHRHKYSVFSQNGTRYLRQHKVMYEDFRLPSSSTLSLQH
jgi:hypothetical protein